MGLKVWIDAPLGSQLPDPATPVPRNFTAYGGYRTDIPSLEPDPVLKVICRLRRLDTNAVVCTVDPCAGTDCNNTRWTAPIVVPNAVPEDTVCRLEVALVTPGTVAGTWVVVDDDQTERLAVKTGAAAVEVVACAIVGTPDVDDVELELLGLTRRVARGAPVAAGVAAAVGGVAGAVGAANDCCCEPAPGPVPYTHNWDFVAEWTPRITSAVCVVYDRLSGRIDSITPAEMSLGRVVARILIPLQLGTERYTARFLLFVTGRARPVRNSPPKSLPLNSPGP